MAFPAAAGGGGPVQNSYILQAGVFVKENVAILPTGVTMRDAPRTFVVDPESLQLGELLGRGASSYVQAAIHKPTGTPLALKVMSVFDKGKRAQLVREIQALYDADCDTLVSFLGAYLRDGTIAIALEYMNCGTLARVAKLAPGGRIPERTLAAVAYQLFWALAYLRVEKRLHRDIKPSNVLVSASGHVKLGDFGLSSELTNSVGMAATFTGTARYMSPERIGHSLFSFAADVWSAGLVLLECAVGRYPYPEPEAASYIALAEAIVEGPAPSLPPEAAGAFSGDFATLLRSCLAKAAEERLPADIILGSPWFARHGVTDLEAAIAGVRAWLVTLPGVVVPLPMGGAAAAAAAAPAAAAPVAAAPIPPAAVGGIGFGSPAVAAVAAAPPAPFPLPAAPPGAVAMGGAGGFAGFAGGGGSGFSPAPVGFAHFAPAPAGSPAYSGFPPTGAP